MTTDPDPENYEKPSYLTTPLTAAEDEFWQKVYLTAVVTLGGPQFADGTTSLGSRCARFADLAVYRRRNRLPPKEESPYR